MKFEVFAKKIRGFDLFPDLNIIDQLLLIQDLDEFIDALNKYPYNGMNFTPKSVVFIKRLDTEDDKFYEKEYNKISDWLEEHCLNHNFVFNNFIWIFEDVNDAVLFKLTWG